MPRRLVIVLLFLVLAPAAAFPAAKPKVRTLCAFVRIDRAGYRAQIGEALDIVFVDDIVKTKILVFSVLLIDLFHRAMPTKTSVEVCGARHPGRRA